MDKFRCVFHGLLVQVNDTSDFRRTKHLSRDSEQGAPLYARIASLLRDRYPDTDDRVLEYIAVMVLNYKVNELGIAIRYVNFKSDDLWPDDEHFPLFSPLLRQCVAFDKDRRQLPRYTTDKILPALSRTRVAAIFKDFLPPTTTPPTFVSVCRFILVAKPTIAAPVAVYITRCVLSRDVAELTEAMRLCTYTRNDSVKGFEITPLTDNDRFRYDASATAANLSLTPTDVRLLPSSPSPPPTTGKASPTSTPPRRRQINNRWTSRSSPLDTEVQFAMIRLGGCKKGETAYRDDLLAEFQGRFSPNTSFDTSYNDVVPLNYY